ncbi:MAG: hypothetical protein U9N44_03060 [Chloroflexota bacterium]|nr:hypothetical protein [Chloroflexota bacterium]
MKITRITTVLLLSILLMSSISCGGPSILKPKVSYIPSGWYLENEKPYGEWPDEENGYLYYWGPGEEDGVMIRYGTIPSELVGKEADSEALIDWFSDDSEETGVMTLDGEVAGYALRHYSWEGAWDRYDYTLNVVFIKNGTFIWVNATYYEGEKSEVMSLIESVTF